MLKQYSTKKLAHTVELLHMYRLTLQKGKYDRNMISSCTGLPVEIAEGRWYAEIKRTRKFGSAYDWKTQLNALVQR